MEPFPHDEIKFLKPGWLRRLEHPNSSDFFTDEAQAICRLSSRATTDASLAKELRVQLEQEKFQPKPTDLDPAYIRRRSLDFAYALAVFGRALNMIWLPLNPIWEPLSEKKKLSPEQRDLAIRFLERSPYFFRSGYSKQYLISRLYGQEFSNREILRIENILRMRVLSPYVGSMPGWRKLARLLPDEKVLRIIEEAMLDEDPFVRKLGTELRTWKGGGK